MKKLLILLSFSPLIALGQNFHFSGKLGLASYYGDLKEKTLSLSQSKFMGSIGARYDLSEHLTARSYISFGSLKGDDKKGNSGMQLRNLNFQSSIIEWEAGLHYSILNLNY